MQDNIVVLKFGSSVLRSAQDLPTAAHEIYRWYRDGYRVLVVVSALGNSTDDLLKMARQISAEPEGFATAELLATGERACAALLGITLDRIGVRARVADPDSIQLRVRGTALDSQPLDVEPGRIHSLFATNDVLIVPGFFGLGPDKRVQVLGRGGSDLTAVFLADALNARRCRLIKDVDGVYESDPALSRSSTAPRRYERLGYEDAARIAAPLIQLKAISFSQQRQRCVEIAALGRDYSTAVRGEVSELGVAKRAAPTRVAILGAGTVGSGVCARLLSLPDDFLLLGVFTRTRKQSAQHAPPAELTYTDIDALEALMPEVVVDALPGVEPSASLISRFLRNGIGVVSANKAALAAHYDPLHRLAERHGAHLRYAAAVGGSAPMIESLQRIRRTAPITTLTGILNGTCNFVLQQMRMGLSLDAAIKIAQAQGFAEADPSEDVSGRDVERKLQILLQHAFGGSLELESMQGLDETRLEALRERGELSRVRLIAAARLEGESVRAQIGLQLLADEHPLLRLQNEWNGLLITTRSGQEHFVAGRGAGRWPTTEAVVADLWQLRRLRSRPAAIDSHHEQRVSV